MTGVSTSRMKPSDISLTPWRSNGTMRWPSTTGRSEMPNIIGIEGP